MQEPAFAQRVPYPSYVDDQFLVVLQGWLPLVIMLSFIYPAINIVKNVVVEKEKRLKVGSVALWRNVVTRVKRL